MRRRDATHDFLQHRQPSGWSTALAITLSLGLHAAMLGLAAMALVRVAVSDKLIRISLTATDAPAGGPSPFLAALQPAAAPLAPVAPAQPRARKVVRAVHPPSPAARMDQALRSSDEAAGSQNAAAANSSWGLESANGGSGIGSGSGGDTGTDQRPSCVYCPQPRYPLIARSRGWQGSVDVSLLVLADGSVDTAALQRSSGYGALDEAAIAVARQSRFRPPAAIGLPAPLRGRIEYRFELTTTR